MNNKNIYLIALLLSLGLHGSLHAEPSGYYRWTDEAGDLKLSDRPPKGDIKAEFIATPGSKASRTSNAPQAVSEKSTTSDKKGEESKTMEILPEKDPKICAQAKSNLTTLSGKTRIRIIDADGNKSFITDEERKTQIERAKQSVEIHCN